MANNIKVHMTDQLYVTMFDHDVYRSRKLRVINQSTKR